MNPFAAWKKILLFGLLGAVGCCAGWLVGEPFLLISRSLMAAMGREEAPSLITTVTPREPPPPPQEFLDRLQAAGAKTGDVQISLIWFNTNDLDLHCVDPSGFEIYWRPENRRSRTGGELDVDRNANCKNLTVEPVENIYWPPGKAPQGKYQVYLNYFQRCPGAPDETSYKISVLHGGERKEFSGTIKKADTPDLGPKRLIYEFQLAPKIELYAPTKFQLSGGQSLTIPVAVRREFYDGPVTIHVDKLPSGLAANKLELSSRATEGKITLQAATDVAPGEFTIRFVVTGEDVNHALDCQLTVPAVSFSLVATVLTGIWTALLAAGLCVSLVMGQNYYLGKPLLATERVPLALLVGGAIVAGFVSGSIGQALYFVLISVGIATVGLILGWMLLGLLLGGGVGFFIPNLDVKKAALAGWVGGLLGGIAFAVLSLLADVLGRWGGAVILGFCIGLMVAVVETVFRRAWLEVWLNDRESITVNLGFQPVTIGSDAKACTVWARDAAPVALCYSIRENRIYCQDITAQHEVVVGDGDRRRAGRVTVVVRTSSQSPPAGNTLTDGSHSGSRAARVPPAPPPLRSDPPVMLELDEPAVEVAPPPPSAKPHAAADWDDGLPQPATPPPARPGPTPIIDVSDPPRARTAQPAGPPTHAGTRPPVPAPPPRLGVPPVPSSRPTSPPTRGPTPPGATSPAVASPDSCPSCGRKIPGGPGQRYCMLCDKTF